MGVFYEFYYFVLVTDRWEEINDTEKEYKIIFEFKKSLAPFQCIPHPRIPLIQNSKENFKSLLAYRQNQCIGKTNVSALESYVAKLFDDLSLHYVI